MGTTVKEWKGMHPVVMDQLESKLCAQLVLGVLCISKATKVVSKFCGTKS